MTTGVLGLAVSTGTQTANINGENFNKIVPPHLQWKMTLIPINRTQMKSNKKLCNERLSKIIGSKNCTEIRFLASIYLVLAPGIAILSIKVENNQS